MNPDSSPVGPDEAIDVALEGEPRAVELRRMTAVLRERHARLSRDWDAEPDQRERSRIERELNKLDEQIAVLSEEANITGFIEDSVRVGIEMRKLHEG